MSFYVVFQIYTKDTILCQEFRTSLESDLISTKENATPVAISVSAKKMAEQHLPKKRRTQIESISFSSGLLQELLSQKYGARLVELHKLLSSSQFSFASTVTLFTKQSSNPFEMGRKFMWGEDIESSLKHKLWVFWVMRHLLPKDIATIVLNTYIAKYKQWFISFHTANSVNYVPLSEHLETMDRMINRVSE